MARRVERHSSRTPVLLLLFAGAACSTQTPQGYVPPASDGGIPQTLPATCTGADAGAPVDDGGVPADAGGTQADAGAQADGGVVCTCPTGYTLNGTQCTFINECESSPCGANQQCNPEIGAYSCTCNAGFVPTDAGACVMGADGGSGADGGCGPCSPNASCSGSTCVCDPGYFEDGGSCAPDESNPCSTDNGGCSPNASCTPDVSGGVTCTCDPGYSGDGFVCTFEDPCSVNNGGCSPNATCASNGSGGVTCTCDPGFVGDGGICVSTGCESNVDCPSNAPLCDNGACVQCESSANCGSDKECSSSQQCVWILGFCGETSDCSSLPATALCDTSTNTCVQCLTTSNCLAGQECLENTCLTENPCSTNNGGCSADATCSSTSGQVTCTCDPGFSGDGGVCVASSSGQVGDSCTTAGSQGVCQTGLTCTAETSPFNSTTLDICTDSTSCTADSDCGTSNGLANVCFDGLCLAGCNPSASSCGTEGFACWTEIALNPPELESFCYFNCSADPFGCGYGASCNAEGACVEQSCTSSACPTGEVCGAFGLGQNSCVPDCRLSGNTCGTGTTCTQSNGLCEYGGDYKTCGTDGVCPGGGVCVTDTGTNVSMCLADCSSGQACPTGQACIVELTDNKYVCAETCTAATTCPASTTCATLANSDMGCLP